MQATRTRMSRLRIWIDQRHPIRGSKPIWMPNHDIGWPDQDVPRTAGDQAGRRSRRSNPSEAGGHWRLVRHGKMSRMLRRMVRVPLAAAPPFTGTCPIAYDGQEQVLTWLQDGKPVTVASCEHEFDPTDPLVIAASELSAELA